MTDRIKLTLVMPCVNEAETLAACIEKARLGVERSRVLGEILVADNGSEDDSVHIAENAVRTSLSMAFKALACQTLIRFPARMGLLAIVKRS